MVRLRKYQIYKVLGALQNSLKTETANKKVCGNQLS